MEDLVKECVNEVIEKFGNKFKITYLTPYTDKNDRTWYCVMDRPIIKGSPIAVFRKTLQTVIHRKGYKSRVAVVRNLKRRDSVIITILKKIND